MGGKQLDMGVNIVQLNAGKRSEVAEFLRDRIRSDLNRPMIFLIQEPFQEKIKDMTQYEHTLTSKEKEDIRVGKERRKKIFADFRAKKLNPSAIANQQSLLDVPGEFKGIRASIFIDNDLNEKSGCHMLTQFTDPDQVAVRLNLDLGNGVTKKMVLCSAYLPGSLDAEDMIRPKLLRLVEYCKVNKLELLLGGDVNAHSTDWYCDHTDSRGEKFSSFCIQHQLQLIIDDKEKPTFKAREGARASRGTIIDLTIATAGVAEIIHNWEVSDEDFGSDHNAIHISLDALPPEPLLKRSRRSTDWRIFANNLSRLSELENLSFFMQPEELDVATYKFNDVLFSAFEKASRMISDKPLNC